MLISTLGSSEREILRGIGEFARGAADWSCQFQQPDIANFERLRDYRADGVITGVSDLKWVSLLEDLEVPVVNVAEVLADIPFPTVRHDSLQIGQIAFDYFAARGFERVGYAALRDEVFGKKRGDAFAEAARSAEKHCSSIYLSPVSNKEKYGWRSQDADLIRWLRTLEMPLGILASNDGRAIQLIEAAKQMGLRIPDDIAVVGIDNDALTCSLCRPPLSSVELANERLGFEAAKLLDVMMRGKRVDHPPPLVGPVRIVTRQSSDVLAVTDPDLSAALRYIRDNAHRPLRADAVANQVAIARRSLERRFMAELGHTILDEIQAVHVDLAKQLLAHTDLSMPAVAEQAGFGSIRHLPLLFRKLTGQTPTAYRATHRLRG